MPRQRTHHRLLLLLTFSWLILAVSALSAGGGGHTSERAGGAFWPGGSSYNPTDSSSSNGHGHGNGGGGGFPGDRDKDRDRDRVGFDIEQALNYRRVHGILAAAAVVVLFPVGSILLRLVPGRVAVWVHACFQMLAWGVYVAAAGVGVYLVRVVRVPGGGGLLQNPSTRYHPIIGLVLLALLVIQPVIGFIHHRAYKKAQKRQLWSYLHLAIGRVGITLGIVNGGLGLYISNASAYHTRVYSIVAGVIWALWMAVAVWAEIRKLRQSRHGTYTTVSKPAAGGGRISQD